MPYLEIDAFCPICRAERHMVSASAWLRDDLICPGCISIPRNRALTVVLEMYYPEWQSLAIHESSPSATGTSRMLRDRAPGYSWSYFDPAAPTGQAHPTFGWRNENLEQMSFAAESFDLFVTQDVFEHIFHPDRAVREIARVLRPGGAHICTVPIVNKTEPSRRRARLHGTDVEHLCEAQYHGNPVSAKGSLATVDWGYDIADYLDRHSGLHTTIIHIDDLSRGIRAEYNEVLCMRKLAAPAAL